MKQRENRKNYMDRLNMNSLVKLCQNPMQGYGYRELCNLLNLEILNSGSNSQAAQLKQLSNYCDFEFNAADHKYYFNEYYIAAKDNQVKRINQLMLNQDCSWVASMRKGIYGIFSNVKPLVYVGYTSKPIYQCYSRHLEKMNANQYPDLMTTLLTQPHTVIMLQETDVQDENELRAMAQSHMDELENNYMILNRDVMPVYNQQDEWKSLFKEYQQRHHYSDKEAEKMLYYFLKYE